MPIGLTAPSKLQPIKGVELATTAAAIRYADRDDMVLIRINEGASVSGVFTQNKFCAAPVAVAKAHLAKQQLASGNIRALLINSGNANAGTGSQGMQNAQTSCDLVAQAMGIDASQVLPFSTGVIGEQLNMQALTKGVSDLADRGSEDNWLAAANAIMTTDTIAKAVSEQVIIDGHTINVTGMAKGSGMICPNMATLLSYVATDAGIEQSVLDSMLQKACAESFNRITVDSDTSTNDALILVASNQSELAEITSQDSTQAQQLYAAIERVMISLATAIIRDAEGVTKFVKISVQNGQSQADCAAIAYSVAHSLLVKTALFASDPNWGRLLMAVGKAEVQALDIDKINLSINGVQLLEQGEPAKTYTEAAGKAVFEQAEIEIVIDLNVAGEHYHVWTSDLSHEYVSINADYRS